jgi:hypothetical protein
VINIQNVKNKKNKFCFKKNVKKKKENLVFFNIKKNPENYNLATATVENLAKFTIMPFYRKTPFPFSICIIQCILVLVPTKFSSNPATYSNGQDPSKTNYRGCCATC